MSGKSIKHFFHRGLVEESSESMGFIEPEPHGAVEAELDGDRRI